MSIGGRFLDHLFPHAWVFLLGEKFEPNAVFGQKTSFRWDRLIELPPLQSQL